MKKKITIVVVTYQTNSKILLKCLKSINKNIKVIIVENSKKFENAQLFYEEGSWYMGQIWQKPLPIIKNDKLIVTQKVIPLLNRIFQTSIFFINFFTFLLILTQI